MLVLSRRLNEDVCFPNLGIRVRVLRTMGNRVRLGIEAPDFVEIARSEPTSTNAAAGDSRQVKHRLQNELNALRLMLEVFNRQIDRGEIDAANCTFLRLIARLRRADAEQGVVSNRPDGARPLRVMVVDDDANERELLAGLLQMDGCLVDVAEDGLAALGLLERGVRPDVLLLDMHMPRLDGRQTLSAIRNNAQFRSLLVFAISGSTPDEYGISVGAPDGVDQWFEKPLNPGCLVTELRQRRHAAATVSI